MTRTNREMVQIFFEKWLMFDIFGHFILVSETEIWSDTCYNVGFTSAVLYQFRFWKNISVHVQAWKYFISLVCKRSEEGPRLTLIGWVENWVPLLKLRSCLLIYSIAPTPRSLPLCKQWPFHCPTGKDDRPSCDSDIEGECGIPLVTDDGYGMVFQKQE